MTGTGTVQTFRNQGFTCTQMQPPQPSWNQYDCYKNSANAQQQETIDTIGPGDQVANLEADTLAMSSIDAEIYLGDVATMPFTGSQGDTSPRMDCYINLQARFDELTSVESTSN